MLRQGNPLSPWLFELDVDVLAILVGRAVNHGLVSSLAKYQNEGDVQYEVTPSFSCKITWNKLEI